MNLSGDVIEAFGQTYHLSCFVCTTCSAQLGKQFVDVEEKPYCAVCGKAAFVASMTAKGGLIFILNII